MASKMVDLNMGPYQLPKTFSKLRGMKHFYNEKYLCELSESGCVNDDALRQYSPREYLIHKYSVAGSLRGGRPLGSVIIMLAGEAQSGKTTTLNALFGQAVLPVCSNVPRKKLSLVWKHFEVPTETVNLKGSLGFLDCPPCYGDPNGADKANFVALKKFKSNCQELEIRHEVSLVQYTNPTAIFRPDVYPNIILFTVNATDTKIDGESSDFVKSLKQFSLANYIDRVKPNLIIVLTHVMSISRVDTEIVCAISRITETIQRLVEQHINIHNVPVIPVENMPEENKMQKIGDFFRLPTEENNHNNLFNAITSLAKENEDYLCSLLVGWYYLQPNTIEDALTTMASSLSSVGNEMNESYILIEDTETDRYEFNQFGHAYCPKTERILAESPLLPPSEYHLVEVGELSCQIPNYAELVSNGTTVKTVFRTGISGTKEEYEQQMHRLYKMEQSIRLDITAPSNGRWHLDSRTRFENLRFVLEKEIGVVVVDDIRKQGLVQRFINSVQSFPTLNDGDTTEYFKTFVDQWGTHIIKEQGLGGVIYWDCKLAVDDSYSQRVVALEDFAKSILLSGLDCSADAFHAKMKELQVDDERVTYIGGNMGKLETLAAMKPNVLLDWEQSLWHKPKEISTTLSLEPYYNVIPFIWPQTTSLRHAVINYLGSEMIPDDQSRFRSAMNQVYNTIVTKPSQFIRHGGFSCFPKRSKVLVENGQQIEIQNMHISEVPMQTLRSHDSLTSIPVSTRFCTYLHFQEKGYFHYLQVLCKNGEKLTASPGHIVFCYSYPNKIKQKHMKNLTVGDQLVYVGDMPTVVTVSKISNVWLEGAFCPLTAEGTLVVDGFYVSSYSDTDSIKLADASMLLLKVAALFKSSVTKSCQSPPLIHPFARHLLNMKVKRNIWQRDAKRMLQAV